METKTGTVIGERYEILKQIGKGGMSVVYLAMDRQLNRQWAVKEIRKAADGNNDEIVTGCLIAEANLMKRLDHPALPHIADIIDNGETVYAVMEYVEGESLDRIMNKYGARPRKLVIEWTKQLCDALNYLHSQKPPIIYRDMKPANIILRPDGNLKLIDFGIAREYRGENTADTTVFGTKGYAPPEQYGLRQTDARSDIYALGMTMHYLLTGVNPGPADDEYVPIRQRNPELPEDLERIIGKCTRPDPEDRYQNCSELMYALEHCEEEEETRRRRQKNKMGAFAAGAVFAVLMLITGIAGIKTQIYSTVSTVAFCLSGAGFLFTLFFWFKFRIPEVISELSGRSARNPEAAEMDIQKAAETGISKAAETDIPEASEMGIPEEDRTVEYTEELSLTDVTAELPPKQEEKEELILLQDIILVNTRETI